VPVWILQLHPSGCLERLNRGHHLAVPQVTNAGHHRLLVNIETSTMRMQKFHRSSSAPLAWNPDRRNLESVLRGSKQPVATIRGAQGVPGPTVTRADAHQTHTDLYAHDAKTLYTNTLARFIYRGSETPVGDCYETCLGLQTQTVARDFLSGTSSPFGG
jgi:hypothetical protein